MALKKSGWIASVLRVLDRQGLTDADVCVVADASVRIARAIAAANKLSNSLAFYGAAAAFERDVFDVEDPGMVQ